MSGSAEALAATILIVEDEPKLAALLSDYLRAAGHQTHVVSDGSEVIAAVHALAPCVVLLDIMLPGRDGLDLCRDIRTFSGVPIVMITAKVEEIDRLLGLEIGADDYICKPFSPREVVARVKAILRRLQRPATSIASTDLVIEERAFTASFRGTPLELTPVEFRLLRTLASSPGRVFSRNQLIDTLYTDHRVVTDRTVDSHIKNLRRKLDLASPDQELIRSIYGMGYKFDV